MKNLYHSFENEDVKDCLFEMGYSDFEISKQEKIDEYLSVYKNGLSFDDLEKEIKQDGYTCPYLLGVCIVFLLDG